MSRAALVPATALTLALLLPAAGCGVSLAPVEVVILVTLDTTRADRIGCYGYADASTPALDGLAAEGALFEQAVSPVPTTMPAHATMFTGLYPQDHGVRYNILYKLSSDAVTLAETLKGAGFATAAFPASRIVGERFGLNQGFDSWAEPPTQPSDRDTEHPLATIRPAGEGVDLALDWIRGHAAERSFVWLHFYDAHWPYTPPFPYASRFRDRPYDGEIAYADAQLGRLLAALRESPRWDKTLVIVAGDHGEGLYDHGERYHSTLVYESTQRVPLVVRAPGGSAGARIDEPVTLVDLMPTVLDLTGVPGEIAMRGISLRPALEGREIPRRDIYFEVLTGSIAYGWAELYGVRYGAMKLIDSATPELFDLVDDDGELSNLAESDPTLLSELQAALAELSKPLTAEGSSDAIVRLDPETEAMISALGYVAGGTAAAEGSDKPHPKDLIDLEPEILTAQTAIARGDHDTVRQVSRYVLGRDPTNTWALTALTGALLAAGRAQEALEPARKMVEIVPEGEASWVRLARTLKALGRDDEAYEALEQGLTRAPGSEELSYLFLVASFEAGRFEACDQELARAREHHAKSSRILVMEARCAAQAGDPDRALASLRAAVEAGFRRFEVLTEAADLAHVLKMDGYRELVAATHASDEAARAAKAESDSSAGG